MCSLCFQIPCVSRCPNKGEVFREPIIQCDLCGEELYENDEYLDAEYGMVCKRCVEDMSIHELMEICGLTYDKAG